MKLQRSEYLKRLIEDYGFNRERMGESTTPIERCEFSDKADRILDLISANLAKDPGEVIEVVEVSRLKV